MEVPRKGDTTVDASYRADNACPLIGSVRHATDMGLAFLVNLVIVCCGCLVASGSPRSNRYGSMARWLALGIGSNVVFALAVGAGALRAQEVPRNQSVLERARPEVDPLNVRVGSFIVAPRLDLGVAYNDNIFATDTDTESDVIVTTAPIVTINSNWSRHALGLSAEVVDRRYLENEEENTTSYGATLEGVLDVTEQSSLFGAAAFERSFEERGAPDEVEGDEPTRITELSLSVGGTQEFNRLALRLTGGFDSVDYGDVEGEGDIFIDNDERDYNRYSAAARAGYQVLPGVQPFLEAAYDARRHDEAPERDSDGYRARVGTTLDFTGVSPGSPGNFTGEVFVGYFKQRYDDPELEDPSGFDFGGAVLWNVTGLTSVRLLAERAVQETSLEDVSSYVQTTVGASVEHELLRNLLLQGGIAFSNNDFQGGDRDQDDLSLGFQVFYLANRYLRMSVAYDYLQRDSQQPDEDFTSNEVSLILTLQY